MQHSAGKLWPFNERLERRRRRRRSPHRWRPGTTTTTTTTNHWVRGPGETAGRPGRIVGEPFGNKFEMPL